MFASPQALNPTTYGGAAVSKSYERLGNIGVSESLFQVAATANTTPETLQVKHRVIKVLGVDTAQHLARLDKRLTDTLLGPVQLSARLIIEIPKGTTIVTSQEILDCVGRLIAFEQAAGNLDRMINSET